MFEKTDIELRKNVICIFDDDARFLFLLSIIANKIFNLNFFNENIEQKRQLSIN